MSGTGIVLTISAVVVLWLVYRAVFRWLDVRGQHRVWGTGPSPETKDRRDRSDPAA